MRSRRRSASCHWVLVHDGARPLVSQELVERGPEGRGSDRGRCSRRAAQPTLSSRSKPTALVAATLQTARRLRAIQTATGVQSSSYCVGAHREVTADVTDDAAMVEAIGGQRHSVRWRPREPEGHQRRRPCSSCETLLRARLGLISAGRDRLRRPSVCRRAAARPWRGSDRVCPWPARLLRCRRGLARARRRTPWRRRARRPRQSLPDRDPRFLDASSADLLV